MIWAWLQFQERKKKQGREFTNGLIVDLIYSVNLYECQQSKDTERYHLNLDPTYYWASAVPEYMTDGHGEWFVDHYCVTQTYSEESKQLCSPSW